MALEQKIRDSMKALGTYSEAYEPEIKTLAMLERELTRATKLWKNKDKDEAGNYIGGNGEFVVTQKNKNGSSYQVKSPYYATVESLRAAVLEHRTALGLTPAGLKKLKGNRGSVGKSGSAAYAEAMKRITEKVAGNG